MKKKTGLFKIIACIILVLGVLTWIVPASYYSETGLAEVGMYRVGFFDFFQLTMSAFSFQYFIQVILFLVAVGGFYAVLSKTGKYRTMLESIASKFKGKEKFALIGIAILIALLNSMFGYGLLLFLFMPLFISIILLLGYDRITAMLATFGATLVGIIGAVFSSTTVVAINEALSITKLNTGWWAKLALLVLSLGALIFFLLKAKRGAKVKEKEATAFEDPFLGEKGSSKRSTWVIAALFIFLGALFILACTSWESLNIQAFNNLHTSITEFKIKGHTVFGYIIGTINALGKWNLAELAVLCLLSSVFIGKAYGQKFTDLLETFGKGAAKMIKPALLIVLSYTVLYFAANTLTFNTLAQHILPKSFNMWTTSLYSLLGSVLHVDMLYVTIYMIPYLFGTYASSAKEIALIAQSMFGVVMFVAPTSIMLILGLTYLGIPYKEWIKKVWRLVLILLGLSLLVIFLFTVI